MPAIEEHLLVVDGDAVELKMCHDGAGEVSDPCTGPLLGDPPHEDGIRASWQVKKQTELSKRHRRTAMLLVYP